MTLLQPFRLLSSTQRRAYTACFLGWTLDAFDFFLLTFCLDAIAATFHVSLVTAAKAIFWTLLMRPVGAIVFGALAEKFGRRPTLMINVVSYSVFVMASALAPTFGWFLATRALFGVAMGGEWGVGAALALESLPAEGRGFFSGLLQEGYVVGSMLAALLYLMFPYLHGTGTLSAWRVLFVIGAVPSLSLLLLLRKVEESPAWLVRHTGMRVRIARSLRSRVVEVWNYLPSLLALTVLMTAFMAFSHGTQDLYPTFLKHDHGIRGVALSAIAIVGNVGAVLGGIWFGTLLGAGGEKAGDYYGGAAVDSDDSFVGVESYGGDAGGGRLPDAVHGAGRVGSDPGAFERDVAACGAGDLSWVGVPVGERAVVA